TTYTDTGLEANTKYWYRVYAVADYKSSEKNSVSGTTYTLTSPTPTISTISSSSLKLTWTAAANATSYRIDRRKAGDGTAYETIATTNQTTYTDTGLEANTKYWYRVYAVADYKSSEKNSVSGTTDNIIKTCYVKLYDNGVCLSEYSIKCGTVFDDFLLPDMSKDGYTFDGWYTKVSGGTKFSKGSKVPEVSNLTLYTHWTPVNYKVSFDANGGSCSKLSAPIQYCDTYGQLPEAQRDGYQFLGWYTLKDKGVLVTSDTVFLLTKDQTLYAHWEKINLLGDLNQDNKITLTNLIPLQKYLLCQTSLTADQSSLADLNEDGMINVIDLILLKRTLLNP
ncbi:MAG: InlB B-repeat-containing protein, partial [Oscillospiraceae bacterium]|nr:InlB B-repeat-containing protein [Oscillospiraceae bacterium]